MDVLYEKLRERLAPFGQEHVLRFWDRLDAQSRLRLSRQVETLDLALVDRLVKTLVLAPSPVVPADVSPADVVRLPRTEADRAARERARRAGEKLLREGKVACVLVAGGHGTRLGFNHPKGELPVTPVKGKSLFELHVEKIRAISRRCGTPLPLCVMTSDANTVETRDYFARSGNFGLPDRDLRIFVQGSVPAVDFRGKLILDAPDHVFTNPNGHGGVLSALIDTGMLAELKGRGVTELFHFQVDNVLAVIADPVFLGLHHEARAGMSCKVARKRDPIEKVGVAVKRADGRVCVVEYSDLDEKLARRTEPDGSLSFWAGSLAMHCYSVEFVESAGVSGRLTFHLARKKVPCVDERGSPVEPAEPNGVKFETFVFDALPMAEQPVVLEIDRAREFSPVKNADGEDSPATARRDMMRVAARWLEEAGIVVPRGPDGEPKHKVEVSPLAARDVEELRSLVARLGLKEVTGDLYLGPEVA